MSEHQDMLIHAAEGIFSAIHSTNFGEAWMSVEEAGFGILLLDEADAGFGGDWSDFFAVMKIAGQFAVALPIGETILGRCIASRSSLSLGDGVVSIATRFDGRVENDAFVGTVRAVPWGREADQVVVAYGDEVLTLDVRAAEIKQMTNLAGEPRDDLLFDAAPVKRAKTMLYVRALAAFLRVAQLAGAIDAALAMSIEHVNTRKQFGRPLAKFQAVQQNLAVMANEAAAVNTAGQAAAQALDRPGLNDGAAFELAAAKLRANLAVDTVTAIAHQVHGAIGFTEEYPLHRYTRRMMSWRSEYGNDRFWAEYLGARVTASGGVALWQTLTARTDPADAQGALPGRPSV